MIKKQIRVFTWNDNLVTLVRGKILLQHLIGSYYIARIGYGSLLNLDYCIHFERTYFKASSGHRWGVQEIAYNLLKKPYASNVVRNKTHNKKRGILRSLTRGMSLRILLRQLPKAGAINLPPYRYDYQFVAVCLYDSSRKILDVDCRCRDPLFLTITPSILR